METPSKAFTASCAVHFGISGLLLFSVYQGAGKPDEIKPDQVFELISAPVEADPNAKFVTSPADGPPLPKDFKLVKIKSATLKWAEPVPDEPAPTPTKNTTKPSDKPADKPSKDPVKNKTAQTSFDEFAKGNPTTAKTTSNKGAPQIQYHIPGSKPGEKMATPRTGELNIPLNQNDINLYMSLLEPRIKQAWRKPPTYALIECEISFDVSASGLISNVRLHKSSGDSAFDQAALDALRSIGSGGPTPKGKPLIGNTITFNTKD